MFDLEDALRERDARQVLRLIRRFNLEKDRLNREKNQEAEERRTSHRDELRDLDAQRRERIRILNEELAFRIAQIRRANLLEPNGSGVD